MASIDKRVNKDGSVSWKVRWREGKDKEPRAQSFDTEKAAKSHRRSVEEQFESRGVGSRETTFAYLDRWIIEKEADKRNPVSPSTVAGYVRNIGYAKRGFEKDRGLSTLTPDHLDKCYDNLLEGDDEHGALSKRTVLHVHRMLHKAFADAKRAKLIGVNPASEADAPRAQKKKYKTPVRGFTRDEVAKQMHLTATDKTYEPDTFAMLATYAVTGMRRGELCGLGLDAVEWDATPPVISIFRNIVEDKNDNVVIREQPKTEASVRKIEVPRELIDVLREQRKRVLEGKLAWGKGWRSEPMFLFPGTGGEPMRPRLVTRRFTRIVKRAGIVPGQGKKISPVHSWRHTSGSILWHAFKDVKQIQERLGHSDPQITLGLYTESLPEVDSEAARVLGALIPKRSER
ncbi:tyrosine-type recombinase/integrase [Bradyrhizobium japonicum]|uniref:tyrosine-type recombinase/integrase n=1 Tax=Bradyrhizobium japonicum TaxID=375 RepID=UPI001E2A91A9|nr:tyrosine-type recombinase/integrase [Bradyrhizobium japonicum]MCD9821146.1 site-specific integrase [Bradyrhizobium japonicum]MEB2674157.1 tyrosine-type recombinase/integrase [Bradyrhizobium japonicum]WRI93343.1 tyrosine-type recombinase/integrase [Bradyrhizobium japonicum]